MDMGLAHIDPGRNRWRWYVLCVQPTLFGEWSLIREWGRRSGNDRGQPDAVSLPPGVRP